MEHVRRRDPLAAYGRGLMSTSESAKRISMSQTPRAASRASGLAPKHAIENGGPTQLDVLWAHQHADLRNPHQIVSQWKTAADVDPRLLECTTRGDWWGAVERSGQTLLVSREYEHLVLALTMTAGRPRISYLHLPHPSGIAVRDARGWVSIASTRNPNQIFDFAPCDPGAFAGSSRDLPAGLLLPVRSLYLPGRLYLHDIAQIGGSLYANAAGLNAVVRLDANGFEPVWWPRSIDSDAGPRLDRNYIQLNSIAAGQTLEQSFFTASAASPSRRRPGHMNFAVDRRGVVFSGATRDVCGTGLTRPHSARLWNSEIWVDNSGYGECGRIVGGKFEAVHRLPGWTRGLCFAPGVAFVGTSRVIPKYARYAPGLDADRCESGLHAIDLGTGRVVGSILWPSGNQIFAVESIDATVSPGFAFISPGAGKARRHVALFSKGAPVRMGDSRKVC
jgi:uncharacterized protein (TIGR03032 family)